MMPSKSIVFADERADSIEDTIPAHSDVLNDKSLLPSHHYLPHFNGKDDDDIDTEFWKGLLQYDITSGATAQEDKKELFSTAHQLLLELALEDEKKKLEKDDSLRKELQAIQLETLELKEELKKVSKANLPLSSRPQQQQQSSQQQQQIFSVSNSSLPSSQSSPPHISNASSTSATNEQANSSSTNSYLQQYKNMKLQQNQFLQQQQTVSANELSERIQKLDQMHRKKTSDVNTSQTSQFGISAVYAANSGIPTTDGEKTRLRYLVAKLQREYRECREREKKAIESSIAMMNVLHQYQTYSESLQKNYLAKELELTETKQILDELNGALQRSNMILSHNKSSRELIDKLTMNMGALLEALNSRSHLLNIIDQQKQELEAQTNLIKVLTANNASLVTIAHEMNQTNNVPTATTYSPGNTNNSTTKQK